jgi:hypothetical protein
LIGAGVGLANAPIFAILIAAICGRGTILQAVVMPLLRFIVIVFLTWTVAMLSGVRAHAEPLDRESCLKLRAEQSKLLTREMRAALERGPDWVKDHLNTGEIEKVREFLAVEETIEFRCRGGGVVKQAATPATGDAVPLPDRKPDLPPGTAVGAAETRQPAAAGGADVPVPDRKPGPAASSVTDVEPSQALADSDKTAPAKTKATR